MLLGTEQMRVFVPDTNMAGIGSMSKKILGISSSNGRLVTFNSLRSFCGGCVSLSLAISLDPFYTSSLQNDISIMERKR